MLDNIDDPNNAPIANKFHDIIALRRTVQDGRDRRRVAHDLRARGKHQLDCALVLAQVLLEDGETQEAMSGGLVPADHIPSIAVHYLVLSVFERFLAVSPRASLLLPEFSIAVGVNSVVKKT